MVPADLSTCAFPTLFARVTAWAQMFQYGTLSHVWDRRKPAGDPYRQTDMWEIDLSDVLELSAYSGESQARGSMSEVNYLPAVVPLLFSQPGGPHWLAYDDVIEDFATKKARKVKLLSEIVTKHDANVKHQIDQTITTVTFDVDKDVEKNLVEKFLQNLLWEKNICSYDEKPMEIFRLKGILSVVGCHCKVIVQAVHELFDFQETTEWTQNEKHISRLVFIGRNLDRDMLRKKFDECIHRVK